MSKRRYTVLGVALATTVFVIVVVFIRHRVARNGSAVEWKRYDTKLVSQYLVQDRIVVVLVSGHFDISVASAENRFVHTSEVEKIFKARNVIAMRTDLPGDGDTSSASLTLELMKKYKILSIPSIIILRSDMDPLVLQREYNPASLVDALSRY